MHEEMDFWKLVMYTLLGLACCYAFTSFIRIAYFAAGPYAAMLSYPNFALVSMPLLRRIVMTLIRHIREASLRHLQGKYYVYQGIPIKVTEDQDRCRWVPVGMVRKIAKISVTDHLFSTLYPSGWRVLDGEAHLRDDALVLYLASATSNDARRFGNWVQKNIAFPSHTARARLGIVIPRATEAP